MLEAKGLTYQPQILLVGPKIENIETIYISIDNMRYEIKNILEAVSGCYKIMFALNAAYPIESANIWLFIQMCLFELEDEGKRLNSQLLNFVNKFNRVRAEDG